MFLTREKSEPNEHGYKPEERPIDQHIKYGCIILDKWSGPTSHDVSEYVRKKLNLKKAAHAGTLV